MNPRQRRGVLFIVLAGVAALTLFFVVADYVASVNQRVAPLVTVYRAADQLPAYTQLSEEDLEAFEVPKRYVPEQAVLDRSLLPGQRVAFTVSAGTTLSSDMLLPASALQGDEREIAVQVDAVTGIAGRVRSGDFVDIYSVFAADDQRSGSSQVLVRNVRVVSVGGVETRSEDTAGGALAEAKVIPVTLALRPEDALKVTYADAFATSVRLVGLPSGIQTRDRADETGSVDANSLGLPAATPGTVTP